MNIQKLSLSAFVIAGLVAGGTPTRLQAKLEPAYVGFGTTFALLTLITLRLDAKKSVPNPEDTYDWSDVSSNIFKGNFREAMYAFDEKFIGQKAKPTSLKIDEGDDKIEIKGTSKTPATGVCGNSQAYLASFAKASVETGKVLAAPGLILAFGTGALRFTVKDNALVAGFSEKLLETFGLGKKTPVEEAKEYLKEVAKFQAIVQTLIDNDMIGDDNVV